jgi:hypothetical protein
MKNFQRVNFFINVFLENKLLKVISETIIKNKVKPIQIETVTTGKRKKKKKINIFLYLLFFIYFI